MATTKTFSTLIADVIETLSQVPGSGVQVYAEDRIAQMLQNKFEMVFDELWWPDYMQWFTRTLDGTQGVTTQNLDDIKRWEDIQFVYRNTSPDPLPLLPQLFNPNSLSGTTVRYIERYKIAGNSSTEDRVIQFWPKTSTDTVHIHARVKPDPFTVNDEVFMDWALLVNGAAYEYAEDDGTNPGAINKFQSAFEARLAQLKAAQGQHKIVLDSRVGQIPTEWYETGV